jgi:glutathione S-transferase
MKPTLYYTQRCPYARRTRIVLHEKGMDFEVREVDPRNKIEKFLEVSPTGKVPVIVVDGDSLDEYPNVAAWMERLEGRESYREAA